MTIAPSLLCKIYFNHSVKSPKDNAINKNKIISLLMYYRTMKFDPLDINLLYT